MKINSSAPPNLTALCLPASPARSLRAVDGGEQMEPTREARKARHEQGDTGSGRQSPPAGLGRAAALADRYRNSSKRYRRPQLKTLWRSQ